MKRVKSLRVRDEKRERKKRGSTNIVSQGSPFSKGCEESGELGQ